MKSIQLTSVGGPEVLRVTDVPLPDPQPGCVRVAARSIGVSWPDVLLRRGAYRWMPPLPAVPGSEMAGVVEAVGQDVTALEVGQRVLISARELPQRGGCYSEALCVPQDAPFPLPTAVDWNSAASLGNYQVAIALLECACVKVGGVLLIPGAAGSVASALTQVASLRGHRVIAAASTDEKREVAKENGAHHVIDGTPSELPERVRRVTAGRGVDIAFDHVGGALFSACLNSLGPFGMLVSYNVLGGPPDRDVFTEMRRLLDRSVAVRTFSMHTLDSDRARRRAIMHEAMELMAAGRIRAPATLEFPLEEAARAHAILESGNVARKIVLRCRPF